MDKKMRPSDEALKRAFAKLQVATARMIKEGKFDDVIEKLEKKEEE